MHNTKDNLLWWLTNPLYVTETSLIKFAKYAEQKVTSILNLTDAY